MNNINLEYINDGKLIHGNALDILKKIDNDIVDLGVTSPPYNKQGKQKGWLVKNIEYEEFDDAMPEDLYQQNQINVINEIYRIVKHGGSFFYNHKLRWDRGKMIHPIEWLIKTKWTIRQEIIWDRSIAANIRGWRFWQVEERIYWLYKPIRNKLIGKELKSEDAKLTSIWRGSPESGKNNTHPAPYPLWLPARIIISILNKNIPGIVLDPYVGSGTTAVAAKLLGHKYIGIDNSEKYINDSNDRLNNSHSEIGKIHKEISFHNVDISFEQRKMEGMNVGKFKKDDNIDVEQLGLFSQ